MRRRTSTRKRRLAPNRVPLLARKQYRRGFSLLEIVLSLAILSGAMAVLGEAVRSGMENARIARDLTDAQLFCESKMAELEAGFITTDPVTDMPIEPLTDSQLESEVDPEENEWLYSISSDTVGEEGIILVYLSVYQDPNTVKNPVSFTLKRMILDESQISLQTTEEEL